MPWHCLQGPVPGIGSDCSGLCTHRGQNLLREGLVILDLEGLRGSHVTFQNFKSSLVTYNSCLLKQLPVSELEA